LIGQSVAGNCGPQPRFPQHDETRPWNRFRSAAARSFCASRWLFYTATQSFGCLRAHSVGHLNKSGPQQWPIHNYNRLSAQQADGFTDSSTFVVVNPFHFHTVSSYGLAPGESAARGTAQRKFGLQPLQPEDSVRSNVTIKRFAGPWVGRLSGTVSTKDMLWDKATGPQPSATAQANDRRCQARTGEAQSLTAFCLQRHLQNAESDGI